MSRRGTWAYLLLVLLWTARAWWPDGGAPLLAAGSAGDVSGTIWTYTHAMRALSGGPLLDAPGAFFPFGLRHVAMYDLGDALLAAPLMAIAGVRVGYNLFVGLLLMLNLLAGRALARACDLDGMAAWCGGALLGAATYVQRELGEGRPSQALLAPMALALAGTLRVARGERSVGWLLLTGVTAAWTALTSWYYGAFLLGMGVVIVVAHARERPAYVRLAGVALLGAALVAPAVLTLAQDYGDLPGVARALPDGARATVLDRGEFGLYNALRVSNSPGFLFARPDNPIHNPLAWTVMVLAAAGAWRWRRAAAPWLMLAAAAYVLSLGPWLKVGHSHYPMPFLALYKNVPMFDRFWWPQRFEAVLTVALVPLVAAGVAALEARGTRWAAVLTLGVVFESMTLLKWVILPAQAPPAYEARLYTGLDGAVLTVPVMSGSDMGRHLLWLQAHHGHPILAGLGENIPEHRPAGYTAFVEGNALLRGLHRVDAGEVGDITVMPDDVSQLLDAGFRWAVLDPAVFGADGANPWMNTYARAFGALWGPPDRDVDGAVAWRIRPIQRATTFNLAYSGDLRPLKVSRPW